MTPDAAQRAADRVAKARRVVVLTGAGVSAESGLRTFRDATTMEGLWKEFDPQKLATPEAFAADPATVSKWYDWRRLGCLAAEPNPGHTALAAMERAVTGRGGRFTLLTQNVDRLHQRAGSVNVVELHGTIIDWRCTRTGRRVTLAPEAMTEFPPKSPFEEGRLLRPDVVWFGEMLPPEALSAADEALAECDLFMSVGTSAMVWPAAGFVRIASASGAFTIEVNRDATPISGMVDVSLRGSSGEILPRLVG